MNRKSSASYTVAAFAISGVLAVAVAVAVCQLVFNAVTLWAVIGVAAAACWVGSSGAGTLVEGIVITIIIVITGMVVASAITSINFPTFWSQVLLSASIGICTGQLVLGTYYDFFSPSNVRDDLPSENQVRQDSRQNYSLLTGYDANKVARQVSATAKSARPHTVDRDTGNAQAQDSQQGNALQTGHKQSDRVLQEYDTVRVVRLNAADREFDGTEGVCRPPTIGDVAIIANEYAPDDPTASVAVEMVDDDGHTVWLADFDRNELEFVWRPERE